MRVRGAIRFACAALFIGAALWTTWVTASHWAPCLGAAGKETDPACIEAMSSYDYTGRLTLWFVLAAIVVALVAARIVPRFPLGAVALVAVVIACPMFDDGFFWDGWGGADGVPGHGLWSACWLAVTGLILVYPHRGGRPSIPRNVLGEAVAERSSSGDRVSP